MARELETMQDGFQALQTGYGILGAVDYARFPASSVPQLSLSGDKPFTIFTTLCFRNVQGGILFEQPDLFLVGIMDGQLYVVGLDWCRIKFAHYEIDKFPTEQWNTLSLVFDGKFLTFYLDGEKIDTCKCTPKKKHVSKADLIIGKELDAWFRTFRLFDRALSDDEIRRLTSGSGITPADSILWFDFDKTARRDHSPNQVKLTTKAFCRIVLVKPVRQFRFTLAPKYFHPEENGTDLFGPSGTVNFTGFIGTQPATGHHAHFTGMVSLGTPQPVMCELDGELVTLWESITIPQTD